MSSGEATLPETGGGGVPTLYRDVGLTGRVAVTWSMAGAVLVGGFGVGIMTLAGRLSGNALFYSSTTLAALGAVAGFIHGAILAYLGRPMEMPKRDALGRLGMAALYCLPGFAVAWLMAGWIAMTQGFLYDGGPLGLAGMALGWAGGVAILLAAAVEGVKALGNGWTRWPSWRSGTVLVGISFLGILAALLAPDPRLFGNGISLTEVQAVLLAIGLALWITGPMVTGGILALERLEAPRPHIPFTRPGRILPDLVIGVVAGGIMAGILWGIAPRVIPPLPGTDLLMTLATLGKALLDEIIFRLFAVSAGVWLLKRWGLVTHPEAAAVVAILGAAALETFVYMPGLYGLGLPTLGVLLALVGETIFFPALLLGGLFWFRGLSAAFAANVVLRVALYGMGVLP